jgi:hypothetical protein
MGSRSVETKDSHPGEAHHGSDTNGSRRGWDHVGGLWHFVLAGAALGYLNQRVVTMSVAVFRRRITVMPTHASCHHPDPPQSPKDFLHNWSAA